MNRHLYILLLNLLTLCNYAQIAESFSDSISTSYPTKWFGQLNDFQINQGYQLQSIGNSTGTSLIYTPIQSTASMEWEFWIRLNFAPSESNRLRIYLQSHDTIFSNPDAYYIEIGDNGNLDAIKFYRQSRGKTTLLAEGTSGAVSNEPVIARLKINKSAAGYWTLSADYKGGKDFKEEWSVFDTMIHHQSAEYFALLCLYTSTRKDKFLFDDIFIHKDTIDHIPLRITRVDSDSNEVRLYLNKPVDSSDASTKENYVISNPGGMLRKAKLIQDSIVLLTLVDKLVPVHYEIICKTFKDKQGISSNNLRAQWTHNPNPHLNPYELLITEMMIDPSPGVQLPPYEYIEIYNNSNHMIDVSSVLLKFETNKYIIDNSIPILPGDYLILCGSDAYESLKSYGKIIKMNKWPPLRNTNGTIGLYDSKDSLIHSVQYDDSWYGDAQKNNGGWSLEMINPENVCDRQNNWMASNDPKGGTPGKVNSIHNKNFHVRFTLDSMTANNDRDIILFPNKSVKIYSTNDIAFSPSLGIHLVEKSASTDQIVINLTDSLVSGVLYGFTISLHDCIDRSLEMIDTFIAKIESPGVNDLVISEILFNPKTGGSDYLEIYNRSNKIFSSSNLIISNENTGKQQTVQPSVLLLPSEYWVITPDPVNIKFNYTVPHPLHLIKQSLPTLPDDHGQVSVWTREKVLIDSCTYDQNQQFDFLNSKEGVSLERIDLETLPIPANWHSASGGSGYGTPTGKNSVAATGDKNPTSNFKLRNKVFSPNDDGADDLLSLEYTLSINGYLARIDIFDDQGRPVKRLANNLSLAYTGSIEWNGKDDKNRSCPSGIYIISIQSIHENEKMIKERIACVLLK